MNQLLRARRRRRRGRARPLGADPRPPAAREGGEGEGGMLPPRRGSAGSRRPRCRPGRRPGPGAAPPSAAQHPSCAQPASRAPSSAPRQRCAQPLFPSPGSLLTVLGIIGIGSEGEFETPEVVCCPMQNATTCVTSETDNLLE